MSSQDPEQTRPLVSSPASAPSFMQRLRDRWEQTGSLLCVGLDTEYERLPGSVRVQTGTLTLEGEGSPVENALVAFNQAIIDATADLVCAFKPNSAFYEANGLAGIRALMRTIEYIHARYPEIPVLLDAKRGDIGSTSAAYARAAYDVFHADAITLHPYLGSEALTPFLRRADRGAFILCRTSNLGSGEFQRLTVAETNEPLYVQVALAVANDWNTWGNCGLVVGATYPAELQRVRALVGDMPILVPGIGAQGGDLEATLRAGVNRQKTGLLISSSRTILYASSELDFAMAARREAQRLAREIERLRHE